MSTSHRGRPRLEPDPKVRAIILDAALEIVRDRGVHGWGIAELLDRTHLSTRAFYRHFDSKDQLVAAMFLEVARVEAERLQQGMADEDPVRAVVAWIDGRLDLAFDQQVESSSRQLTLEAHAQIFTSPELVGPAYLEILRPLIGQIDRGDAFGAVFQWPSGRGGNVDRQRRMGESLTPMGNRDLWPRRVAAAGSTLLPARLGRRRRRYRRGYRRRDYLLITTEQINRACPWACVCGLRRAGPFGPISFAARSVGWTLSCIFCSRELATI